MPPGKLEAGSEGRPGERGRSLEWGRRASVELGPPRRPLSPCKRGRPGQQPKQRQPKRATARSLGLWALLIFISFAALYSQLRVAGSMGDVHDHGAGQRHGLLKTLAAAKGLHAKQEYRRLHSHEVTVGAEQLQCSGRLGAATVRQLSRQLKEERQAAALRSFLPPPLFLADPGSRHKRCRASPSGSERPPRLHRVALFTPEDAGGLDWVRGPPQRADRDEMRLTQRLRALLAQQQQQQAVVQQQPAEQQQQQQQQLAQRAAGQQQSRQQQRFAFGSVQLEGAGGEAAAAAAAHSVLGTGGSVRGAPPADITVVTQLSIDRLPSLKQQCASWRGPTVAVVYAPLVQGLLAGLSGSSDGEVADLEGADPLDALAYIRRAYADIAALKGGCSLTLEFVVEERCTEALAGLWPINANRNRALMLAATPAVVLLDVDFLVGGSLSPWLRAPPAADSSRLADARRRLRASSRAMLDGSRGGTTSSSGVGSRSNSSNSGGGIGAASSKGSKGGKEWPSLLRPGAGTKNTSADDAWLAALLGEAESQQVSWLEAVLSQNAAVVLPAFQTATTRRQLLRGRRIALAAAAADKAGVAAMATSLPPQIFGFQQDKYPRGHKATRYWSWVQASQPYAVDYWQGYEPFLLMPTARTPFYDERFRGYGWDKHVHTLHAVRQLGMKLVVHPDAWLVHLPHEHSAAQSLSKETGQRAKLHDLFVEARRRILNKRFVPVSAYFKQCSPSLAEHPKHLPERNAWVAAAAAGKGEGAAQLHAAWHQQQAALMAAAAAELEVEQRQRAGEAASDGGEAEEEEDADGEPEGGEDASQEEQQELEEEEEAAAAAAAVGGAGQSGDEAEAEDEREQAAWSQELEQRMEEEGQEAGDGEEGQEEDSEPLHEQAAGGAAQEEEEEEAQQQQQQQALPRVRRL